MQRIFRKHSFMNIFWVQFESQVELILPKETHTNCYYNGLPNTYQYLHGSYSTIQWNDVQQGSSNKAVRHVVTYYSTQPIKTITFVYLSVL